MAETRALSLTDLDRYGRIWGAGRNRQALCPLCGDDHRRDQAHASLSFDSETGAWHCFRCKASGKLDEFKDHHEHDVDEQARTKRRRGSRARKTAPPPPRPPSPAELAEQAAKRDTLRRLWSASVPIDKPAARAGADYLWEVRRIPLVMARDARVRFARDWYGRPAVVFPVQDSAGRLVAAEARYIDKGTPKSRSAGRKAAGVFVASLRALDGEGVAICEGPITALSLATCGLPAIALCGHSGAPAWLARRLALRRVHLALDWDEDGADKAGTAIAAELATLGAKPHRLRPRDFEGDWNDYLVRYGREALRDAMGAALKGPAFSW
jgi:phage/plasmid primase-like uncharacterized protein